MAAAAWRPVQKVQIVRHVAAKFRGGQALQTGGRKPYDGREPVGTRNRYHWLDGDGEVPWPLNLKRCCVRSVR